MSEKRIFETDDKFWEVWIEDSQVLTHFGKTGAAGQTKIKATADAAAAEAALEDMVAKKKKEGYRQSGGPKAAAGPALDAKELKKHISALTSANDPAVLVLADWLQTQNHPWGELIALQFNAAATPKKAAALEKAADKLLEAKGDVILGSLADDKRSSVTWHSGFVQRATIGSDAEPKAVLAAAKSFLAQPIAKLVDEVVFNPVQSSFPVWRDWDSSMEHVSDPWPELEKLAALVPAGVTKVGFGAWPSEAAGAYTHLPSFTKISKAFPKLTKLGLTGTGTEKPGKLSLPALTELAIHFATAGSTDLSALAGSKFPKLERLTLGLGGRCYATVDEVAEPDEWDEDNEDASRYPDSFNAREMQMMDGYGDRGTNTPPDQLATLLASALPSLAHLSFESSFFSEDLLEVVLKSKLLKQLKSLDLSNGSLNDTTAKLLLGAKKQLAHLESIDLRRTGMTPSTAVKVAAAFPKAKVGKKAADKGPDFFFRYIACME
jgi:predicted DNA-binding WGR domain protein